MSNSPVRPRRLKGAKPARSVRIDNDVWEPARHRAAYEGVTISYVIEAFLEGYSKGLINLPTVQVKYQQPTAASE